MFRIKKGREGTKQDQLGGTLDSVHQTVLGSLRDSEKKQVEIRRNLKETEELTRKLETSNDILELSRSYDKLRNLQTEVKNANPIDEYFLKNADIMLQYYKQTDRNQSIVSNPSDNNTFLKYLTSTLPPEDSGLSKKQMFDEYVNRMKLSNGYDVIESNCETEHCNQCNVAREEVSAEGILVCPNCGSEEYMMVVSDFPSFRDPPKERNNYAYKKINHLNEILNQFQAKESTIIPDEVMNEVVCEIKKRRIQNIAELCEKDIREILKKLNRSKYYEHAAHIVSRLNGNPPPTITPEIEEKIRAMFQDIQAPFLLYCPNDRTNFLSYSYILYKFFELLELDEYKVYFPLLKSRDRLISHDQIWKKICDYLRWEFIVSI